jgi:succinate dehydrogenase/fumarate reductase cytochrome b subunit
MPPAARRVDPAIGKCDAHPEVDAAERCRVCVRPVCATCDFSFPGGLHFCAQCVEKSSSGEVDPARKRLTYISMALATWSTILMAMLFGGAFSTFFEDPAMSKVADLVITNIILWPLLFGVGLSFSAIEPKLENTGVMKAAAWWNGVLTTVMMLIIIAANLGLMG